MHLHYLMTHAPILLKWMGQKYNCNFFFDLTKEQGHFQVQCLYCPFFPWDLSPNNSHMILFLLYLYITVFHTTGSHTLKIKKRWQK